MSSGGILDYPGTLPPFIKLRTGTQVDGFVDYRLNKHWLFRVGCTNILNQTYVMGAEQIDVVDPSYPRDVTFQTTFKF